MKMEMIKLNLDQQLQALIKNYPNYQKSISLLQLMIDSLEDVEKPSRIG
jgi:hypothetical protein